MLGRCSTCGAYQLSADSSLDECLACEGLIEPIKDIGKLTDREMELLDAWPELWLSANQDEFAAGA